MVNKRYKKENTLNEAHFEGLLSFARQVRNRFIFFLLFAIYSFLNILSTSDKMLFMQTGIKMPLLNIELPLLAFYVVMPLFLVALHFNLLYVLHTYREYLANTKKNHPLALKSLPFGLYEGALLNRNNFLNRLISIALTLLIYILPLIVLFSFWFRFADYQNSTITYWHLALLLLDFIIVYYFRVLLSFNKKSSVLKKIIVIGVTLFVLAFILPYQYFVINVINDDNVTIVKLVSLKKLEESVNKKSAFLKDKDWFLPRLVIRGEVLVPIDKELLEVLSDLKDINSTKKEPLLLSMPPTDYSNRSFKLAILDSCIIVRANFEKANLQGANLQNINLQLSNLIKTNLIFTYLNKSNLKNATLYGSKIKFANFSGANLEGANIGGAYLQDVDFFKANLQGANISGAYLQGANFNESDLRGTNAISANFMGVNFNNTKLQGANFSFANLQGSKFLEVKLQGANFDNTKLQAIELRYVSLEGLSTDLWDNFNDRKGEKTDLSSINRTILTIKEVDKILKEIKPYITKYRLKEIKIRLQKAIGKDPIEWVKSQNPNLGVLTKEMADRIAKEVTNKKARENMGLESN